MNTFNYKILYLLLISFFILAPTLVLANFTGVPIPGYGAYVSLRDCETNTTKEGVSCFWEEGMSWCGANAQICRIEPTGPCPSNPANGSYSFSCNSCDCQLTCNTGHQACNNNCTPVLPCEPNQTFDACSNTCIAAPSQGSGYAQTNPFFFLAKSGFVGIGTSTPNRHLHIYDSNINSEINLQSVPGINMHWGIYNEQSDNSFNIWGSDNHLTILRNGNVGIGTTSPTKKLSVVGDVVASNFCLGGDCRSAWPTGGGGVSSVSNSDSTLTINPTTGEVIASLNLNKANTWNASQTFNTNTNFPGNSILNSVGEIGLGTTSPFTKLHLYHSSAGPIISLSGLEGSGNYRGLTIKDLNNTEKWFIGNNGSNNFVIRRNSAVDNLTIDSSGNISMSTTTVSGSLTTNSLCLGGDCRSAWPTGGGGVSSVSNSDNTLTINPTAGEVIASLNLNNANTWNAVQSFNQYLGIGTTSPNRHLHIYDISTNAEIDLQSVAGADKHWSMYVDKIDNSLRFWGDNDHLSILRNGRVGIGTNSPSASSTLHVIGNIIANDPIDSNHLTTKNYVDTLNIAWSKITSFPANCPEGEYVKGIGNNLICATPTSINTFWTQGSGDNIYRLAGNIGLGTTTPQTELYLLNSSSGPIISLSGVENSNYQGLALKDLSDAEKWFVGSNNHNNFVIRRNGGVDDLTISSSTGDILMSTTTVSGSLTTNSLCLGGECINDWTSFYYGGGEVFSVFNIDETLTINPIFGDVEVSLNLAKANTWTASQTFNANTILGNNAFLGIGIATPSTKLHLSDADSGPIISLSGGLDNFRGLAFRDLSNTEKWFVGINNYNKFVIRRSEEDADDIIVDNLGNVGIGTTSPTKKLSVVGDVVASKFCLGVECINKWPTGGGGVSSVSNLDNTLTINPNAGEVIASLNLSNDNTWTASQTFNANTNFPNNSIWNSAGEIGIGTSTPQATFHLNLSDISKATSFLITSSSGTELFKINNTGVLQAGSIPANYITPDRFDGSGFSFGSSVAFHGNIGANNGITLSSGNLLLSAANSVIEFGNGTYLKQEPSHFTIASGGKYYFDNSVMIASSTLPIDNPKLFVNGAIQSSIIKSSTGYQIGDDNILTSARLLRVAQGALSSPSLSFLNSTNTGIYLPISGEMGFVSNSNEVMRVSTSTVGIGTSSPQAKLHVYKSSSGIGYLNNPTLIVEDISPTIDLVSPFYSNAAIRFVSAGASISVTGPTFLPTPNKMTFSVSGGFNFTGGNVGIATASPAAKLHVNGSIRGQYQSEDGSQGITQGICLRACDGSTCCIDIKNGIIVNTTCPDYSCGGGTGDPQG